MYFYWQKTFHGGWAPVKSTDMPDTSKAGKNGRPAIVGIQELTEGEQELTLFELAEHYRRYGDDRHVHV